MEGYPEIIHFHWGFSVTNHPFSKLRALKPEAAPDVPAVPAPDGAADAGAEEGGDDQVASRDPRGPGRCNIQVSMEILWV